VSTRLDAMLPEDGNRVRFPNVVFFKEVLDDGPKKKKVRVSEYRFALQDGLCSIGLVI